MENGVRVEVSRKRPLFTCFVCDKQITLRPIPELPVDPFEALKELRVGKKPVVCISCGREHAFNRSRPAFRRYLQFLAMHLPESAMEELEGMA